MPNSACGDEGKRYSYREVATGRTIEVDAIIDGDTVLLIPLCAGEVLQEHCRKLKLLPDRSMDELIREGMGSILAGCSLAGVDEHTVEIDWPVLYAMRKTPISLRDGEYLKEFVDAMILCLDLRRFSDFARDAERDKVKGFLERYTQELLAGINGYPISYYKLLGDGAMVVWDRPQRPDLDSAMELFELLRWVVADIGQEFGYEGNLAGALAVDELYKYEIYAEASGLKYRDYVGYGINLVFRLQAMAGSGELLSSAGAARRFGLELPALDAARKPARSAVKGVKDEDYEGVLVLIPGDR